LSFLLDTNVVSEWVKPIPDPGLVEWLTTTDEEAIYLSVVTLAELRYAVERLRAGQRRARLEKWLQQELRERFSGRILPVDERIADAWGRVVVRCRFAGRPISVMDAFIAATAEAEELVLVTRNDADFASAGIRLHNPWA
jgi:predicted nucleic acid-binding protein